MGFMVVWRRWFPMCQSALAILAAAVMRLCGIRLRKRAHRSMPFCRSASVSARVRCGIVIPPDRIAGNGTACQSGRTQRRSHSRTPPRQGRSRSHGGIRCHRMTWHSARRIGARIEFPPWGGICISCYEVRPLESPLKSPRRATVSLVTASSPLGLSFRGCARRGMFAVTPHYEAVELLSSAPESARSLATDCDFPLVAEVRRLALSHNGPASVAHLPRTWGRPRELPLGPARRARLRRGHCPVLPKPPAPRAVSVNLSSNRGASMSHLTTTSWAILAPM